MRSELEQLRDRVKELEQARAAEKLDDRFKAITDRMDMQEEATAGQIKLLRTDLATVNSSVKTALEALQTISVRVDSNTQTINRGIDFQIFSDGAQQGSIVNKKLGELLEIHRENLIR